MLTNERLLEIHSKCSNDQSGDRHFVMRVIREIFPTKVLLNSSRSGKRPNRPDVPPKKKLDPVILDFVYVKMRERIAALTGQHFEFNHERSKRSLFNRYITATLNMEINNLKSAENTRRRKMNAANWAF
jgi:hypothetical protein